MKSPLNKAEENALVLALDHEKLDVYRVTLAFVSYCSSIIKKLPPEFAYMSDQIRRASTSIAHNIAEGCGRVSPGDKSRFYAFAKGSATECGAALDVLQQYEQISLADYATGKTLVGRIVSMLVNMAKSVDERR